MTTSSRGRSGPARSEGHTSELQAPCNLVCRLLLAKKNKIDAQSAGRQGWPRALLRSQRTARAPARPRHPFGSALARAPTLPRPVFFFFFFNDTATTEIYTLSLHDALPI